MDQMPKQDLNINKLTASEDYWRSRINLNQIFLSNLKRPLVLIITFLVIFIPLAGYLFNVERQYKSQTVVMVPVSEVNRFITDMITSNMDPAKPEHYYVSILKSEEYSVRILDKLSDQVKDKYNLTAKKVRNIVSYDRNPREPGLILLSSTSRDSVLAGIVLRAALSTFAERTVQLDQQEAKAIVDFIEIQLKEVNEKSIEAEEALQKFLDEKGFIIKSEKSGITSELYDLESKMTVAQANVEMINLKFDSFSSQLYSILDSISVNNTDEYQDSLKRLNEELVEIKNKLKEIEDKDEQEALNQRRKKITSSMVEISSKIYSDQSSTPDRFGMDLHTLEEQLATLNVEKEKYENELEFATIQFNRFKEKHPQISEDILTYTGLVRKRDVLQSTLNILLEKREEARIKVASQLGGIKIIDEPRDARPIPRGTLKKLLVVFFLALFVGIMLAFVIDIYNYTIDEDTDILKYYNFTVLGHIPNLEDKSSKKHYRKSLKENDDKSFDNLIFKYSESSPVSEAYRAIKTSIMFKLSEETGKVFVVSSALPGEGKSLTSANLAISLAQGGLKVLLIDCDLRKPTQHRIWGESRKPGITNHLLNGIDESEVLHSTSVNNLFVISAGSNPPNPAELLASKKMRDYLEQKRKEYDIVILDTPPVNYVVDSRILAGKLDGMVLVVKAEHTAARNFSICSKLIESLKVDVFGVILNHTGTRFNKSYYYAYRYANPYSYYNSYNYYYSYGEESQKSIRDEENSRV